MFVGVLLLLMGVFIFADNMGYLPGDAWDYVLPIALVSLGVSMMFNHKKKQR